MLSPSNSKASSNTSVIFTLVALEGPKLVIVIVKVTFSPIFTFDGATDFVMSNNTTGSTLTVVLLVFSVLFSLQFTTAAFS